VAEPGPLAEPVEWELAVNMGSVAGLVVEPEQEPELALEPGQLAGKEQVVYIEPAELEPEPVAELALEPGQLAGKEQVVSIERLELEFEPMVDNEPVVELLVYTIKI
jgi:hypothetical protein